MNKKALYEKIMLSVAKEVKRALNENNGFKDNHIAVANTIIKLFQNHNIDQVDIYPETNYYYNNAILDDMEAELSYLDVTYDNRLKIGVYSLEIDIKLLSPHDLETLYYIARNIVADDAVNPDEVYDEMDLIYQLALAGTLHIGYEMTDEDKDRLYQAFEECGYEDCNFYEVDGEPVVLDSIYNEKNVSINYIGCNLVCELSDGKTAKLEDIINDPDDIDTLESLISDYSE